MFKRDFVEEKEQSVRKEFIQAYQILLQSSAWKDLALVIDKIVDDSNADVDNVSIQDLTVAHVAKARGLREAVARIKKHVYNRLNGV